MIVLPLPPTTNHIWGYSHRGVYLRPEAKTWLAMAHFELKSKPRFILNGSLSVSVRFFLKRDRDVDNLKLLLDSMSGYVYKDDSQITELHIYKTKDKDCPRVEVEINQI